MQNRFFAMLARMKLIRRWGLMFSTRDENLSEHSLDTAFFMHALLSLHNRRFLTPGEEPLWAPVCCWRSITMPLRFSPATCPPR